MDASRLDILGDPLAGIDLHRLGPELHQTLDAQPGHPPVQRDVPAFGGRRQVSGHDHPVVLILKRQLADTQPERVQQQAHVHAGRIQADRRGIEIRRVCHDLAQPHLRLQFAGQPVLADAQKIGLPIRSYLPPFAVQRHLVKAQRLAVGVIGEISPRRAERDGPDGLQRLQHALSDLQRGIERPQSAIIFQRGAQGARDRRIDRPQPGQRWRLTGDVACRHVLDID